MGSKKPVVVCKHNWWVDCRNTSECPKCGWNPEVEIQRKKSMKGEIEK